MKQITKKSAKLLVVIGFAGLVGCANTATMESLRADIVKANDTAESAMSSASAAKSEAAAASRAAEEAKATADEALRIANEANSRAKETDAKIDRMFKRSMYK